MGAGPRRVPVHRSGFLRGRVRPVPPAGALHLADLHVDEGGLADRSRAHPDSGGRARSFLRASAIDLAMLGGIGGTLVLVAMGVWDSMQYKGQEPPRDFDEPVAWQKLESAVAEVTPVFADFEGFASRSVEVKPCAGM